MEYVNTKEKIADIFTKELPKDAHEYLRGILGVRPLSRLSKKQETCLASNKLINILFVPNIDATIKIFNVQS